VNQQAAKLAIQYGITLISQVSGEPINTVDPTFDWSRWTSLLFERTRTPRNALLSTWSLSGLKEGAPSPARVPTVSISLATRFSETHSDHDGEGVAKSETVVWQLNPMLNTVDPNPDGYQLAAATLGKAFIEHGGATETNFDRFYFLMQKFASTLPCTYGEPGVSLFQQWRIMAAVMALSTDGTPATLPEDLALIGLDLPGIQETVYTIASRGAGKSVRGRSAFLQLLVNAIVERIVDELKLCRANVIVNAGGNALILARWSEDLDRQLQELDNELNRLLLQGRDGSTFLGFQGDLTLALSWIRMDWSALKYPCETKKDGDRYVSRWQWEEKRLKDKLQLAKERPFATLLMDAQGFEQLFAREPIDSNLHCTVCRRPQNKRTGKFEPLDDEQAETLGATQLVCPLCKSFRKLADKLGKRQSTVYLNRSRQAPLHPDSWQIGLHAASGYWYLLEDQGRSDALTLALSPDEFPGRHVDGFWPLATTTPRVTANDVKRLRQEGDLDTTEDDIRDNALLAEESPGTYKRLGILKADVDDLGKLLVEGLGDRRSAALTATLSESLTLFFGGWLDKICAEEPFYNRVYVLYAGGDDLLIIGMWDVIPRLAARIAKDFSLYTGQNSDIHLSAGISIVGGKEPLYAAIEAASKALKQAKRYPTSKQPTKNAIHLMGSTYKWVDFAEIERWQGRLKEMINRGAPRALLMALLEIYEQFQDDRREAIEKVSGYTTRAREGIYDGQSLFLGPWLWQMIYKLHRLTWSSKGVHPEATQGDHPQDVKGEIQAIQKQLLQPKGVEKMAMSARWAQLATRKHEEEYGKTSSSQ
jgi:CRISPR-associated protein Csm1